jgi:hypothetical protein
LRSAGLTLRAAADSRPFAIDFLIRATPGNAQQVLGALRAFGFGTVGIAERDLLQPGQIIQLGYPPNRIDILTSG